MKSGWLTSAALILAASITTGATAAQPASPVMPDFSSNLSLWGAPGGAALPDGSGWTYGQLGAEAHLGMVRSGIGVQGDLWAGSTHYSYSGGGAPIDLGGGGLGVHINRAAGDWLVGGLVSLGLNGYTPIC